jgi:CRP/FNR family transcriptional regulator, cyclic AMP receptor protein
MEEGYVVANEDIADMLGSVDLFKAVPPKVLKRIAGAGRVVDFAPGFEVTTDGSTGVAFHLIMEGSAEVEVGGKARASLKPRQGFGEISLLDGLPRSATVRAGDQGMKTFALTSWEFLPILDENPTIARGLLKVLCARIRAIDAAQASD